VRQVPAGQAALVVEMNRTSGDPVLLRKPAAGGFAAGALPSVQVGHVLHRAVRFHLEPAAKYILIVRISDVMTQLDAVDLCCTIQISMLAVQHAQTLHSYLGWLNGASRTT